MMPYIINVGLILTGCLSFYKLLLQKETFYKLNRYVLVLCLLVAFSLPLLRMPQQLSFRNTGTPVVVQNVPTIKEEVINNITSKAQQPSSVATKSSPTTTIKQPAEKTFSWQQAMQWMIWLYWFGVIVFGLNFLFQIIILLYRAYTSPVIKDGRFRLVEVSGDKAPCSFANNIFINPSKYEWETYEQILQHEKIHIQQGHSFDILFSEIVLIFQWFNPFAWIYRKEIESNLEFLTDDQLVQKEKIEKSSYQMSLLKVSAPHFPLSLTTNYNQSLLKKRITMMNIKRSNVHTTWKYFFLLPLLVILASILNEPIAKAQDNNNNAENKNAEENHTDFKTEGYWFATIKGDKINMQFKDDENGHDSYNGSDFPVSDFTNLPKGTTGDFTLTREAGTMNFNGKFEGSQGMGRYKFVPNKEFANDMSSMINGKMDDEASMTFFFVNITKSYVQMLKEQGFKEINKDELVGVRALGVDKEFIASIRANGYKDVPLEQFTALKALGIDGAYIKDIRDAGYKDISLDHLISFKAQGIDKAYLAKIQNASGKDGIMSADNVVSMKAMNIDENYASSFKALGYNDIKPEELVSMKSLGVTPEFAKEFQSMGYKNVTPDNLISLKAQNVTPEFIKAYENIGYKDVDIDELVSLKALDVKADYIKSFKDEGFNDITPENAIAMKSQDITPSFIKSFQDLGYKNVSIDDAVALKATGVTPEWIKEMKSKGFDYNDVSKYITLKSLK